MTVQTRETSTYDPQVSGTGVGCALLGPVAVIGTFQLIEEHSHVGDSFLLAEIVGWWMLCIGAGFGIGSVAARLQGAGRGLYSVVSAIALTLAFIGLVIVEQQPATPAWVKDAYIGLLKIVGIIGFPIFVGWLIWRRKRTAAD